MMLWERPNFFHGSWSWLIFFGKSKLNIITLKNFLEKSLFSMFHYVNITKTIFKLVQLYYNDFKYSFKSLKITNDLK